MERIHLIVTYLHKILVSTTLPVLRSTWSTVTGHMMAVNSGFESCVLNLPDSSQELNIDARALEEVNVAY